MAKTRKERIMSVPDESSERPLRVDDLVNFFSDCERHRHCPHCDHAGGWEIALEDEVDDPENAKLVVFEIPASRGAHHTVGVSCPNCGHFAHVSTYKIRQYLAKVGSGG